MRVVISHMLQTVSGEKCTMCSYIGHISDKNIIALTATLQGAKSMMGKADKLGEMQYLC